MLRTNLFHDALIEPIRDGADQLLAVAGYASPAMASRHLQDARELVGRDIDVRLVVGMTGKEGLSIDTHGGFVTLQNRPVVGSFSAGYVIRPHSIHSKVYVWMRQGRLHSAFIGSANYTQNGFGVGVGRHSHHEVLEECNPEEALEYFDFAERKSINCDHGDVEEEIILTAPTYERRQRYALSDGGSASEGDYVSVYLPLVQTGRRGEPGQVHNAGAGLNWGHRGNRSRNEAYIPVPSTVAGTGFFPPRGVHFGVRTDDGKNLVMTVAQDGDKALETPGNNSLLGEYFRYRLGLPNGAFVETSDLLRFGSKEVRFFKTDDEQYLMEFSPENREYWIP